MTPPPPLAATLPTFHTVVHTVLAAPLEGAGSGAHPAHQAALLSTTRGHKRREHRRKQGTLCLRHNGEGGGTLQEDDIHLHCCLVSKVRRQLGIRQLRRGNGTSCYWQGTDVGEKVGIRRPFFFWQKSTRETQETPSDCHPMKEKPLNIQAGWHANVFDFTPPTHLTAPEMPASVGQGWKDVA